MKPFIPEIASLSQRKVATVTTTGDPSNVAQEAIGALYGAVYTLKYRVEKQP